MLIAHAKLKSDGSFENPHLLTDHLTGTAALSEKFSAIFGLQKIGLSLGLTHDLGKASDAFQERIRLKTGFDIEEARLEGKTVHHVDHSTAGAQLLVKHYGPQLGLLLAYIVAGHHSGLPDGQGVSDSALTKRLKKNIEDYSKLSQWVKEQLPPIQAQDFLPVKSKIKRLDAYKIQFLIRMLFSALTDADFLDTEDYMEPKKYKSRKRQIDIEQTAQHFEQFLDELAQKPQTKINQKRNEILRQCRNAAAHQPGLFSLTVPTGGGKTISSMAFALEHARKYELRRVIYVIPYTSIIIQNAQAFRDIFQSLGNDIVLEHHSNLEPRHETLFNRLAAENWDAPIVVTTNVQFFESFYANRSSSCRKLHNVADSVIIFDEAQMLPPEVLKPSLSVIKELVEDYGCSAVICTATQPAIVKSDFLKAGLENVREIIPNPQRLYEQFKRVTVHRIPAKLSADGLADRLAENYQALAVVNTRREAREIYQKLSKKTDTSQCFHLSTMMCPQHRADTLKAMRERLKFGQSCRVVSTQLIEAGVDVDFPVVYRAAAGADSLAQAAGRCNREGKLESGKVFVFESENLPPPGHLRQSAESGFYTLKAFPDDPLSLQAVDFYFRDFYGKQNYAHNMDKKNIMDLCTMRSDAIPFAQITREFSFISEKTIPIVVPYGEDGEKAISGLRRCFKGLVPRDLRRQIQRYLVNLRERPFMELYQAGVLEDVFEDGQYFVLLNSDIYNTGVGLNPDNPEFSNPNH